MCHWKDPGFFENQQGAHFKTFYTVYSGQTRSYLDADEIPSGIPRCDAVVKDKAAQKYNAKITTYGEPDRTFTSIIRTGTSSRATRPAASGTGRTTASS
ncbi:hypothetical protein OG974_04865 [Streptomyces sp. NBC_00597]|uniref:hypothetical protein n=1 Tax=Streptomyces sp. NBC_00597 TaxID=2975786 RepID=UPI0030E49FCE